MLAMRGGFSLGNLVATVVTGQLAVVTAFLPHDDCRMNAVA
jgi:hypothetical protein